jgi:phage-related protein
VGALYENWYILEGCALPRTNLIFYMDLRAEAPVLGWLAQLRRRRPRAYAKARARLLRLAEYGHELRRPAADYLQDGIYELRMRDGKVNYRLLYFFHGSHTAVLVDALAKEGRIPAGAVARALRRREEFERDPAGHTYVTEPDNA